MPAESYETRDQPWKKWYAPLDTAIATAAMTTQPIHLVSQGNNGSDHLKFAVFTASSPAAAAAAERATKGVAAAEVKN